MTRPAKEPSPVVSALPADGWVSVHRTPQEGKTGDVIEDQREVVAWLIHANGDVTGCTRPERLSGGAGSVVVDPAEDVTFAEYRQIKTKVDNAPGRPGNAPAPKPVRAPVPARDKPISG